MSNPSFETYTLCPSGINSGSPDQVSRASGWFSSLGTPEYFNSCASFNSDVSVPNNKLGSQMASTGNAYCGFIPYGGGYREILSQKLSSNLVIGQKYFLSMRVSRPGNLSYWGIAINKLGIKLSTLNSTSYGSINNSAHMFTSSIITDSTNWILIRGTLIADSSYQYINVGNFFDDVNTNTISLGPSGACYYYVDDICLAADSSLCFSTIDYLSEFIMKPKFNIYPNPFVDIINVENNIPYDLLVFDMIGEVVFREENISIPKKSICTKSLPSGVYFIKIKTYNKTNSFKFIKT